MKRYLLAMHLPRRMLLVAMAVLMALVLMVLVQVLAAPSSQEGVWGVRDAHAFHSPGKDTQGRPVIGGLPGHGQRNENATFNPSTDNRTEPNTGGQRK